ncbi:hypothetical protein C8R31_101702 [Nitrosospira sp. Nsp2]|nr:hypothetical protein C8R31_101702 [Nitrosospira sp. Nsp2]
MDAFNLGQIRASAEVEDDTAVYLPIRPHNTDFEDKRSDAENPCFTQEEKNVSLPLHRPAILLRASQRVISPPNGDFCEFRWEFGWELERYATLLNN